MSVPKVVLVGPSGGGRSSVAAALADRLGLAVRETEDVLEESQGAAFAQLALALDGDDLKEAIGSAAARSLTESAVVTLVPSALEDDAVFEQLRRLGEEGVPIAAITADLNVLVRRVGLNAPRSAALGQPRKWFREFVAAQRERYLELGAVEFDTGRMDADQVAERIAQRFALQ